MRPALLIVALVAVQVTLGALTVLSRRDPWINSFHVVCGALVLTTSLVITLRSWRGTFAYRPMELDTAGATHSTQRAQQAPSVVVRLQPDRRGPRVRDAPIDAATIVGVRASPRLCLRGLCCADQTALEFPGGRDQRRGLLPRRNRQRRRGVDGAGGRRHGARGRRGGSAEPAVRARHGRVDAADAASAAARRPHCARRCADLRSCALGLRPRRPGGACELAVGGARARDAADLPRDLHADETADAVVHDRRRGARCAAGADRLDGVARQHRSQRRGALRHRVLLAAAALHGDRVAVPGRLREGRLPDAAGDRSGRQTRRQAGGLLGVPAGACQPGTRRSAGWPAMRILPSRRCSARRCSGSPCGSPPRETRPPPARSSTDRSPICRCSGSR